jgi:hypothetical protein
MVMGHSPQLGAPHVCKAAYEPRRCATGRSSSQVRSPRSQAPLRPGGSVYLMRIGPAERLPACTPVNTAVLPLALENPFREPVLSSMFGCPPALGQSKSSSRAREFLFAAEVHAQAVYAGLLPVGFQYYVRQVVGVDVDFRDSVSPEQIEDVLNHGVCTTGPLV